MDRRLTPFSGRIGHLSLRGQLGDLPLTAGEAMRIASPLAPLLAEPYGAIDRQLLCGDAVTVIDQRDDHAFAMAAKDGYCGWLALANLAPPRPTSHRVVTPATHLYAEPRVQAAGPVPLFLNSWLTVTAIEGDWALTPEGYVPMRHLAPRDRPAPDPVAVAESLLHAPYLWGGNSHAGVDCSGLVQLAFHAADQPCPADSDQQRGFGTEIAADAALQRGDLLFWPGHVALATAPDQILHANGYTMSVAHEPLAQAVARIKTHYGGEILNRRRPASS